MRFKILLHKFKSERAASSIGEYSVVLPICLFIFGLLFMAGYMLNQQANLDAATNRGVLVAQKIYCDPNVDAVMNLGTDKGAMQVGFRTKPDGFSSGANFKSDPYRYLGSNYKYDTISSLVKTKVLNCIEASQLLGVSERVSKIEVDMPDDFSGFIVQKLAVKVTQQFHNPFLPTIVNRNVPTLFTMESCASASVMNSSEFVRNTNLVNDLIEKTTGSDVGSKIADMIGKASDFFSGMGK